LGGRVEFDVSRVGDAAFSLEELVDALACESRVLCVVSSRKAARLVFEALRERFDDDEGLFHLSALMVPAHRSEVIEGIRNRLACGLPCRAVSTQLIEAGVDLDFPVLYRETAGIDSMLQAAGRCNRNGRLPRRGRAVMFDCLDFQGTKRRGTNWLATQRDLGLETIDWGLRKGVDPFGREGVQRYFNRRHETAQTLDEGDIYRGLTRGGLRDHFVALGDMQACVYSCEFRRIADAYRIVDDDGVGVFVPWGSEGAALLDRMKGGELGLGFGALVQRFSVSLPPWMVRECRDAGSLYEVGPWLVADIGFGSALTYDELGLGKPSEGPVFDYIVM
jgi:CRISPR-associated endonuclease/helicase Cas3